MVAGLAVPRLALKWPNDLLLDGAKIAGILVEGTMLPGGGPLAVVIGIGSMSAITPRTRPIRPPTCAPAALICSLTRSLQRSPRLWPRRWTGGTVARASRPFAAEWVARAAGIGEPIIVRQPEGERRGIFRDLGQDGALMLEESDGIVAIQAGDVFPAAMTPSPEPGVSSGRQDAGAR